MGELLPQEGSTLFINPLMALYWCFRLDAVARRVLYMEMLKATQTYIDVDDVIDAVRFSGLPIRPRRDLPM